MDIQININKSLQRFLNLKVINFLKYCFIQFNITPHSEQNGSIFLLSAKFFLSVNTLNLITNKLQVLEKYIFHL